ncbi:hypothetical protein [Candidatus Mesenet endosymbiont of Phosphuga atrata]|uniref:hypothetical protein n=1 Tax=Candidatus Mesenet endosymbiont of Phosphuga atrata TaxID=3066221 RepID=UPI0030D13D99
MYSEFTIDAGCVEGAFHNAACINHKEIVELLSKHEVVDTKDSDKVLASQLNEVSTESVNQSQHIV